MIKEKMDEMLAASSGNRGKDGLKGRGKEQKKVKEVGTAPRKCVTASNAE